MTKKIVHKEEGDSSYTIPYLYDPEMDAFVHVSHFGALKTSATHPVLKANFPGNSLDLDIWSPSSGGGAHIIVVGISHGIKPLF